SRPPRTSPSRRAPPARPTSGCSSASCTSVSSTAPRGAPTMAERAPRAALAVLALAAALGAGCSDQGKVREEEMTQLLALLPGRYDNSAQVEADLRAGSAAHERIALVIAHVYTPRLGHHVFYAQEMAADDPRRVLSQKMYSFESDEKRGIV